MRAQTSHLSSIWELERSSMESGISGRQIIAAYDILCTTLRTRGPSRASRESPAHRIFQKRIHMLRIKYHSSGLLHREKVGRGVHRCLSEPLRGAHHLTMSRALGEPQPRLLTMPCMLQTMLVNVRRATQNEPITHGLREPYDLKKARRNEPPSTRRI